MKLKTFLYINLCLFVSSVELTSAQIIDSMNFIKFNIPLLSSFYEKIKS